MSKHIFVTGGVVSGLGKGITAASLGMLLKANGIGIMNQKLDPYMNADTGRIIPLEHGEVFVLEDGTETNLDLGHYERFTDVNMTSFSTATSGKIYGELLKAERDGKFNGKTIQVIPHITDAIKKTIYDCAKKSDVDVLITEIGGTVGDMESRAFLEAARQISIEKGANNCIFVHVVLVPYISASDEHKSKPTQHSIAVMQGMGISPDIIVTRSDENIDIKVIEKISKFCNVPMDSVIQNPTVDELYELPLILHNQGLDNVVCKKLHIKHDNIDLSSWKELVNKIKSMDKKVCIAIVGKYMHLKKDSYLSVVEALSHAGYKFGASIDIKWIDSDILIEEKANRLLKDAQGIIVPSAFGASGVVGMMVATKYARENNIPFFGIGMGMQIAMIEFAKNVINLENPTSEEFDIKSKNKLFINVDSKKNIQTRKEKMRVGTYDCTVKLESKIFGMYQVEQVSERHRNIYEFDMSYKDEFEKNGMILSVVSKNAGYLESVEYNKNNFFIGVLFQPEFKSRPNKPHPLFLNFVKTALEE